MYKFHHFGSLSFPKCSSWKEYYLTIMVIVTRGMKGKYTEKAFASDFAKEQEIILKSKRKLSHRNILGSLKKRNQDKS